MNEMSKWDLDLNKQFVEEKIRENDVNTEILKKALDKDPGAVKIWREKDKKIKEAINLTWFCLDEIVERSERIYLERFGMKNAFVENMINGMALLLKASDNIDDMNELNDLRMINLAEDAKECIDKASTLFSEAFRTFKKLEGMDKKQEGKS